MRRIVSLPASGVATALAVGLVAAIAPAPVASTTPATTTTPAASTPPATTTPATTPPADGVGTVISLGPGQIDALDERRGTLRAAVTDPDGAGRAQLFTITGGTAAAGPVIAQGDTTAAFTLSSSVLTPSGGAALLTREAGDSVTVRAAVAQAGAVSSQTLTAGSEGGVTADPYPLGATATLSAAADGSVAALFVADRRGKEVPMLSYRPAGAERFRRAVPLGPPARADDALLVALGPGGSGLVLMTPDRGDVRRGKARVRRVSERGRLGPVRTISLAYPGADYFTVTEAAVAFGSDGTAGIALGTSGEDRRGKSVETLVATTWPAGAAAPRTPQRLLKREDASDLLSNAAVHVGRGNRITVLQDAGRGKLVSFAGRGRLTRQKAVAAHGPQGTRLVSLPGGRSAAVWLGYDGPGRASVWAAPVGGGGLGRPTRLATLPESSSSGGLGPVTALSGGQIAASVSVASDERSEALVVIGRLR